MSRSSAVNLPVVKTTWSVGSVEGQPFRHVPVQNDRFERVKCIAAPARVGFKESSSAALPKLRKERNLSAHSLGGSSAAAV